MRAWLRISIGLVILALVVQTWLVDGVITPLVVDGGSMAPALLGEHYHIVCPTCQRPLDCGLESTPSERRVLCPSCGHWCDVTPADLKSPDRLFVDRMAFERGAPARWEMVVCRRPDAEKPRCVKRLVGLPGERIELQGGDVYVDGQIARKDWQVLSAMAILVDAGKYQSSEEPSRWRSERTATGWRAAADVLDFDGARGDPADAKIEWLEYHHEQIWRQGENVVRRAGPILDDLAYNQDESRTLVSVPDVILACRLESDNATEVFLRASDGRKELVVRLDMQNQRGEAREGEQTVANFELPSAMDFKRGFRVVLALADCRLQLIVGDQPVLDFCYEPTHGEFAKPTAAPVAIGAIAGRLRVSEWSISRDVYYLPPAGRETLEPRQLGTGEYWLLGDNSAASDDSRSWPAEDPVTQDSLEGRAMAWR